MKNSNKVRENTVDNRTYKSVLKDAKDLCPYCPPHQGCNYPRGKKSPDKRSWKNFRKTQYKS